MTDCPKWARGPDRRSAFQNACSADQRTEMIRDPIKMIEAGSAARGKA
jgi:hypothetical protein